MKQANEAKRWTLMADDVALGTLTLDELDQPWWYCHFAPTPAFESVRALFITEQAALEANQATGFLGDRGMGQWEKAYNAIDALKLRLVGEDGPSISELLLHIDEDRAWFRY